MKKILVVFVLTILWANFSVAQDRPVKFQHITTENGLAQGHILCMIQDREGYIWIGTFYGLSRYDGYSFKLFAKNNNDSTSITSNVVYSLFEDKNGFIWVGTVYGLDKFDKQTETFEHIRVNPEKQGLNDGYIHAIDQDIYGDIWVATNSGGLNKVDYKTNKVSYIKAGTAPNQIHSNTINDLVIDRTNTLWLTTENGGISTIDLTSMKVKTYLHDKTNLLSTPSNKVSCVFKDKNNKIWFGNFDGQLFSYEENTKTFKIYSYLPGSFKNSRVKIKDIAQDSKGNLLIATMGAGLVIYSPLTGKSQICMHNIYDSEAIISNEAFSLLVDATGTVFVGSYGKGISYYSPARMKFPSFYVPTSTENTQEGDINSYTACAQDSFNRLIIGSYKGFFVFDKKNMSYKHFLPGKTYEENKILSIAIAPDNTIWLGSENRLHRYDKNLNKIQSYQFLDDGYDHQVYTIFFDHQNNLWFGLFPANGLAKVKETEWRNTTKQKLEYKLYQKDYSDSTSINGNQIWCINQDKNMNLWIATNSSVSKYNYDSDNFTNFYFTYIPKTIEFDKDQNLWVTTRGEGIYYFNSHTGKYKQFTNSDGLSQNFVFGAIADKNGDLWFTTENGLSRYYPNQNRFRNYDIYDGLPSNRFDDRSEKQLSDGTIYMGTSKGFVIFDPDEIKDDNSQPNVVLTGLKISNIPINAIAEKYYNQTINTPIAKIKQIELSAKERDFSIEFAALSFAAPHKIKYAYKLEGFDNKWIYTDAKNRTARYTNLDGGSYTFFVKATNCDGVWNDVPLSIQVIVKPPFIKTLWFKILMILSLISLITIYYKRLIKREIHQKHLLEQLVTERTNELTDKNELLKIKATDLKESNTLLEERSTLIEEQTEELKTQRDELVQINAQKDKLFSIIAHDLKNPFNIIMGYADLLLKNNARYTEEQRFKFLTHLKQSSHNAYYLLENLLQWSRGQNKALIYDPVQFSLNEIVLYNINQMNELCKQKEITVDCSFSDNEIIVFADENMVNTILRNLLINAIKFSYIKGSILFKLEKTDIQTAKITVTDKGVGMKKEVLENLFQLDRNISQRGTSGEKGTGLGLIICYDFVKANNGVLEVKSKPNEGTEISFTLPLAN